MLIFKMQHNEIKAVSLVLLPKRGRCAARCRAVEEMVADASSQSRPSLNERH